MLLAKAREDVLKPITLHEARHLLPGGLDEARAAADAYIAADAPRLRLVS